MILYIYQQGHGFTFDETGAHVSFKSANITSSGYPLHYVVWANLDTKLVRTSVPSIYKKKYEALVKELFTDVKSLGSYDSGFYGFEFYVPDIMAVLDPIVNDCKVNVTL